MNENQQQRGKTDILENGRSCLNLCAPAKRCVQEIKEAKITSDGDSQGKVEKRRCIKKDDKMKIKGG